MKRSEQIKRLRKRAGLSQMQLAEMSGLSIGTIQGYEQGRYLPRADSIKKIADALGCSVSEITGNYGARDTVTPYSVDVSELSAAGVDFVEKMVADLITYEQSLLDKEKD